MVSGVTERTTNTAGSMRGVPGMILQRLALIVMMLETFIQLLTSIGQAIPLKSDPKSLSKTDQKSLKIIKYHENQDFSKILNYDLCA